MDYITIIAAICFLILLAAFLVGVWFVPGAWIDLFAKLRKNPRVSVFGSAIKTFEVIAVLLAVFAFFHQFGVEIPRDRVETPRDQAARHAQLVIDMETKAFSRPSSGGLAKAMEILNASGISMRGFSVSGAYLIGADLKGADLREAQLNGVMFGNANLSGADLQDAKFLGTDFGEADLTNANISRAFLLKANMKKVRGLTQNMLNSVLPTAPPQSLPKGPDDKELEWPFMPDGSGNWVRKD